MGGDHCMPKVFTGGYWIQLQEGTDSFLLEGSHFY